MISRSVPFTTLCRWRFLAACLCVVLTISCCQLVFADQPRTPLAGEQYQRTHEEGWEGLIAKKADSRYAVGKRTSEWRKIKFVRRQEFVIGGWTEPRNSRSHFGALLLGVYEKRALHYVGHTGTGFSERELTRVARMMRPLEISTCPFMTRPRTNEPAQWIWPELVAEVKFTEWTTDGKLRHPTYLGLRDDIDPKTIRREPIVRVPIVRVPSMKRQGEEENRRRSTAPVAEEPRGAEAHTLKLPENLQRLVQLIHELEQGPGGWRPAVARRPHP